MFNILLTAGANPGYQNIKGQTPLHSTVLAGDATILQALIAYCTYDGVLQRNRLDIDTQDVLGCSALHHAQHVGSVAAVKVLVANGASLRIMDLHGAF